MKTPIKGIKPEPIKTYLHTYHLDVSKEEDRIEYEKIKINRMINNVELFNVIETRNKGTIESREVELETEFIFGNQWNTKDGKRIFNWYEEIVPNKNIKKGHYLNIVPEMIEICEKTYKCGYCGAEYYGHENKGLFCLACLDSEYLKEDELYLLRLKPVEFDKSSPEREKLTEKEKAELLPLYIQRQTTGDDSRNVQKLQKQRKRIEDDYYNTIANAKTECDGMLWLMDHNVSVDNVIYYDHTKRFCFGWRSPIESTVKPTLIEKLKDFPFNYDIK